MPPARGVKSRCSVHNLQTKGEISRESSGGRGRFTPREFREQRFHHRHRGSLFVLGWIDNGAASIRHESTRSERKTRRSARHPMIWVPNGAYSKQRDETEAYGKSLVTVACCLCNTSPKTAAAIGSEAVH